MSAETETTYTVRGMTCGHCELSVQEEIAELAGVSAVRADHASGRVVVDGAASADAVRAAVRAAGYELVADGA